MKQLVALVLGIGLVGSIAVAPAEAAESTPEQVAYGAGSVLTTLVYAPFKATFCILGGVTSGFTLPFAGPETAGKVATTACGGTWAITPDALKGKERVRFVGGEPGRHTTAGR
jgi:hypothetical protein